MKYLKELRTTFKNSVVFSIKDVEILFHNKNLGTKYLHLMLHNAVKTGELNRIKKGVYTFSQELMSVGFAFGSFYYGLEEALSLQNLWEQEVVPIVITPLRFRSGRREFLGNNYLVRRLERKMFFGFRLIRYYDLWIPVSDLEKTLIDFVYFKQPIPKDVILEIKNKLDSRRLGQYLRRSPKWVRLRVTKLLD